jgi:hypothetical protein
MYCYFGECIGAVGPCISCGKETSRALVFDEAVQTRLIAHLCIGCYNVFHLRDAAPAIELAAASDDHQAVTMIDLPVMTGIYNPEEDPYYRSLKEWERTTDIPLRTVRQARAVLDTLDKANQRDEQDDSD